MTAIGGYFELETSNARDYHKNSIMLNSARNGLRYIIRSNNIKHIYLPSYTCPVVWDAVIDEKCEYILYDLDDDILPNIKIEDNAYIVYNNYFGVCGKQVKKMIDNYPNVIIDNSQAFYSRQYTKLGCFYSPRKFFGLPDGGLVVGKNKLPKLKLEQDHNSINISSHLLKRIEYGAEYAYEDFQKNDSALEHNEIKYMSNFTKKIMGNINYTKIKKIRLRNYQYLYKKLGNTINPILTDDDVPMVYPYITDDYELKKYLITNKIFVATYWPNIREDITLKSKIIPLPIDQRYNIKDMENIIQIIFCYANK